MPLHPVAPYPLTVSELVAGNVQLASPPELFIKLTEILDDPNKTVRDAAQVLESDPGFAARILRLVNSAFYGFPTRVGSINQAVSILGIQELRDLAVATLVMERFSSMPNGILSMREYWVLCLRAALYAKALAEHHPQGRLLNSVFLCGLLHEIGLLVMYYRIPELARACALLEETDGLSATEAEQRMLGVDRYQVGAELMRRWRLPDVVPLTIESHNAPQDALLFNQEGTLIVLAYRLAEDEQRADLDALWDFVGIDPKVMEAVNQAVEDQFAALYATFFAGR